MIMILDETYRRDHGRLLGFAGAMLRWARIPNAEYAPEDAVQDGFLHLVDRVAEGKLRSLDGVDGCFWLLRTSIIHQVIAERDRRDALKRGGPGISRGGKRGHC